MSIFISKVKNNKIFEKALLLRKMNERKSSNDFYSLLLKRKRLEKGLKLEDVASGICSISYLSRLENNQTDGKDENLKLLFEKLDLNYEVIKRERNNNIFEDLLKKELSFSKKEMIDEISKTISSMSYTNIERDLLVLLGSIVEENFEEARYILSKLELELSLFSSDELLFYVYMFCCYLYKTNQNKRAYAQVKVLNSLDISNDFYKALIWDLSIDVAFIMGEYEQVVKFYFMLAQNKESYFFNKKMGLHKLQMLVADSKFNIQEIIKEFLKIKETIDMNDLLVCTNYYYYFALIYFKNEMYEKVLEILKDFLYDVRCLSLYGYLVLKIGNNVDKAIFISKLKENKFTKYDYIYEAFCEYLNLTIHGENKTHLFIYLKQKILSQNSLFYDHIIKEMSLRELIEVGLSSSKYKETLRYISENEQ